MGALNTTFKKQSNGAFNNAVFTLGTIPGMEDERVHDSFERLQDAARQAARPSRTTGSDAGGPSALASSLSESPQAINNWRRRGVSEAGALKAQRKFGCDANWILTGEGRVRALWPFSVDLQQKVLRLQDEEVFRLENVMRAHLGLIPQSAASLPGGSAEGQQSDYSGRPEVGTEALNNAEIPVPQRNAPGKQDRRPQRRQGGRGA